MSSDGLREVKISQIFGGSWSDFGGQSDVVGSNRWFPFARNQVSWLQVYGDWKKAGYSTDACLMFDMILPPKWSDPGSLTLIEL